MKRLNARAGFTLLELLIVIGILAVLATMAVLVINPVQKIKDARIKSTQTSINQLVDSIVKIKGFTGKGLMQITGSGCSRCICIATTTADTDIPCINNWNNALTKITAEGTSTALTSDLRVFARDAWGSPYILDENEGEGGGCSLDSLYSAGPDRLQGGGDDIYSSTYIINVTPACTQ